MMLSLKPWTARWQLIKVKLVSPSVLDLEFVLSVFGSIASMSYLKPGPFLSLYPPQWQHKTCIFAWWEQKQPVVASLTAQLKLQRCFCFYVNLFLHLQSGEIDVVNHTTGDRCHLKFAPYSYFSRDVARKVRTIHICHCCKTQRLAVCMFFTCPIFIPCPRPSSLVHKHVKTFNQ